MLFCGAALATLLVIMPPRQQGPAPQVASSELLDVADLIRILRKKPLTPEEQEAARDPRRRAIAAAPVIGYKPSSGALVGVAGNSAVYHGDPATTRMSSAVASLTFSSKKQTSITVRFDTFGQDNRWALDGDNRAQWTSQDTFGLGTSSPEDTLVNMRFDRFRLYETAFIKVRGRVLAGAGFHYSTHTNVEPGDDAGEDWSESPYVTYSEANGFALDGQTSAGVGASLLADARDSPINARRGWFASASYRAFFRNFLGGDATWQELYLDARAYRGLRPGGRHTLAFWMWSDLVTGGVAPYLDLPATGMDKYGRSGRGYPEGRFRGERLVYGEVEYRAALTRNGLMGVVLFLNTTTVSNRQDGEALFDRLATGGGAGFRLLLNKRSRTNLCADLGWGRDGSRGFYLSVQEAF